MQCNGDTFKGNTYIIDLNVVNDQCIVKYHPDKLNAEDTLFYFAKSAPGVYDILNYGQFVENIKAFDETGTVVEITRKDQNSFLVSTPE